MNKNRYAKQRGRAPSYSDPFESVRCWVPKGLMRHLKRESERLGVPVERLLVRKAWFGSYEIDLTLPSPGNSTQEQQQALFQFLARAPRGVDLDLVFMSHEEVEILHPAHLRWALADLVFLGLAEMFNEGDYAIPKVRAITAKRLQRKEKFALFAGENVKSSPKPKHTKGVL